MADCYHRNVTASGRCADCGASQHGRNAHAVAAFHAGNVTIDRNGNTREPRDRIQSGNGNLASVRAGTGRNDLGNGQHAPVTFLQSYGVTIAIRRDADGATFLNGHSYSPSTGRHQREAGASWRDGVSFPALAALLGPTWYEHAEIIESAPQSCVSDHCRALHDQAVEAWQALRVQTGTRTRAARGYECSDQCPTPCPNAQAWHADHGARGTVTEPEFSYLDADGAPVAYPESRCMFVDIERETSYSRERKLEEQGDVSGQPLADVIPADIMQRGQHELTGDGSGQTFTLLEAPDPLTGVRAVIVCGMDYGKSDGRGMQMFAAICPRQPRNVSEALASLNPFDAGQGQRTSTGALRTDSVSDVKRQGDLFFAPFAGECPCPCHPFGMVIQDVDASDAIKERQRAGAEALRRAGILNRDGTIKRRHGCTRAGENIPQLCKRRDCPPADAVRLDGLELPDAGGRHVATRAALTARNVRFAQGQIKHPEHKTVTLKTWHRVGRSLAVRAMSAAYRQGWTGGRGYAD